MKNTLFSRRLTGLVLLLFPFAMQIPFGLLAKRFDYPDILRQPPEVVLTRFAEGGGGLIALWYAFALLILPYLGAVVALPRALGLPRRALRLATVFGVVSSVAQLVGLLRWTFTVPHLASLFVDPSTDAATRQAVAAVFRAQHALLGVMLGEHVGQLFLALWTAGVSFALWDSRRARALAGVGLIASALMLFGLSEGLATVFPLQLGALRHAPLVAFGLWALWSSMLGAWCLWRSTSSSAHGTPQAAGGSVRERPLLEAPSES